MKVIIGLGNPGAKYDLTRHNIGKRSVAAVAAAERLSFLKEPQLKASICAWNHSAGKVLVAFPDTFMNLSGEAVRHICDYYKIQTDRDLLIILDDVALPFGTVRLRASGSTGGHNGLESIEKSLGHDRYPRLRIGVGEHVNACDSINDFLKGKPLEDFVLERFKVSDEEALPGVFERVVQTCRLWVEKPFEEAANFTNIKRNSDL